MSTKNTTNQSQQTVFDPQSMARYQQGQQTMQNQLMPFATNPFGNSYFRNQSDMLQRQASAQGVTGWQNFLQNMSQTTNRGTNLSALNASQMARQSRQTMGLQSNALLGATNNALGMQQGAIGMLGSMNPLVTGGNSQTTQMQSGLGTWLPQLIGAGLGAAGGAMGMPHMGGGGGGGSFSPPIPSMPNGGNIFRDNIMTQPFMSSGVYSGQGNFGGGGPLFGQWQGR